jgi:arylformamidase
VLVDISPPVRPSIAVWPGDTPLSREVLLDLAAGDVLTLSTLHATVHLGAHTDAPSHYGLGAPSIGEVPLDAYLGPCEVVRVEVGRGERITPELLGAWTPAAPRVLFATGTYPDPDVFTTDFAALSAPLVEQLATAGVVLVGVDTPSVDLCDSKDLPVHHACLRTGTAVLEGIVLDGVDPGIWELVALPLRLEGFDASPVRAVLRR